MRSLIRDWNRPARIKPEQIKTEYMGWCIVCGNDARDVRFCPNCGVQLEWVLHPPWDREKSLAYHLSIPRTESSSRLEDDWNHLLDKVGSCKEKIDNTLERLHNDIESNMENSAREDVYFLGENPTPKELVFLSLATMIMYDHMDIPEKKANNLIKEFVRMEDDYVESLEESPNGERYHGPHSRIVSYTLSDYAHSNISHREVPEIIWPLIYDYGYGGHVRATVAHEGTHSFIRNEIRIDSKYQTAVEEGACFCCNHYLTEYNYRNTFDHYRRKNIPKNVITSCVDAFVEYVEENADTDDPYEKLDMIRGRAVESIKLLRNGNASSPVEAILGPNEDYESLETALNRLERTEYYSTLSLFTLDMIDSSMVNRWEKILGFYHSFDVKNQDDLDDIKEDVITKDVSWMEKRLQELVRLSEEKRDASGVEKIKRKFSDYNEKWKQLLGQFEQFIDTYKEEKNRLSNDFQNHRAAEGNLEKGVLTHAEKIKETGIEIQKNKGDLKPEQFQKERERVEKLLQQRLKLIKDALDYTGKLEKLLSGIHEDPRFKELLEEVKEHDSRKSHELLEETEEILGRLREVRKDLERAKKNAEQGINAL